jgi:GAF domain-containing protein
MSQKTLNSDLDVRPLNWATRLISNNCEPVESLDNITKEAAVLFDVPIVMINLLTSKDVVFKSCVGLTQGDTLDKEGSFCSKAMSHEKALVVSDATLDEEFKDFSLVVGPLGIRSYMGKSLHAPDGTRIGTLCLLDTKPRQYSQVERRALVELAKSAEEQLNMILKTTQEII